MLNNKQLLGLNLICAVAYFLGAYSGGMFALPPGGASPIWPAAGIALAALLLCGNQVLPGLFLGALYSQTFSFLDSSSTESLTNSLIMGIVISLGSCLQALFASWLIKRFVHGYKSLIKDADILRFFLLSGPIACVVTASVGSAALSYSRAISLNDLPSTWATWWIGDTLGTLVFTPLILIFFAHPRESWRSRRNYVAYPLLMLLALVVVIFYYTKQQEEQRLTAIFNQQSSLLENELKHELTSHIAVTQQLKSFFDSSQLVSREEFQQFAQTLLLQHDSVQAVEWIPRITAQQRAEFEKLWQPTMSIHELGANNKITIAKHRQVYFPITFVEPLRSNERALGFDIATNPIALQALIHAQDSGQVTATAKLKLIQDTHTVQGLVIYAPIYDKNKSQLTLRSRKQALQGFVASVFRVSDEVKEVMAEIPSLQLLVKIVDANAVLYSNFPLKPQHKVNDINLYKQSTIKLANRVWTIAYLPSDDFMNQHQSWQRWWLLFGCLLFTSLTGMSLLMLTGRTLRTEELIKIRTQALRNEVSQRENRSRILHALAISTPLSEILTMLVDSVTEEDEEIRSSILLLDEDGQHLKQGAASRLPDFYCQAVNGLLIGEGVGSCGTAAFLGERVIVADIQQHPYWKKFLPLAEQAGIQACWSEPIISSENKVLGTFTLYYSTVKTPSNATIKKIEELAYLASLAIEKSNTEERIRHLAFYDTLTQLPNRRLLNERLTQEIVRLERQSGYGALMFLDLDHFKTLNDSLGHHIGDELLIQVAARLKDCVREQDTVARLGGDEFVVLQTAMSNNSLEQASDCALTIAKRIQAALYIPYSLQGYEHHVTSSIGITLFSRDNKEIDALFKQADTAMYAAKTKGRNTFSFYNSQMQHHADQQLELERDLLIALNNQQFELRYQAQYDFQGLIVSAEALLCWVHPEKGLIDPAEFMPACEKSGLILAIGEWALKTVCQQLLLWPMLQHIAINIPPRQFQQSGFIQQVTDILKEYQLPTSSLMLELTEQAIIKDNAASIEKLTALQSLGVCVAIDNFGVGYSSVAYLKKLPINQIKLDSRFIRDIGDANNNTVIVETMIMIAKQLRLLVAAEGVETEQQLDYLHTMGCNIYQGCYFSEPLPTTEFGAFLAQNLN